MAPQRRTDGQADGRTMSACSRSGHGVPLLSLRRILRKSTYSGKRSTGIHRYRGTDMPPATYSHVWLKYGRMDQPIGWGFTCFSGVGDLKVVQA